MLNDISFPVPMETTCIELSAIYVCTTDQFCNDPLAIASPVELTPHIECCIAAVALRAGVMHLLTTSSSYSQLHQLQLDRLLWGICVLCGA